MARYGCHPSSAVAAVWWRALQLWRWKGQGCPAPLTGAVREGGDRTATTHQPPALIVSWKAADCFTMLNSIKLSKYRCKTMYIFLSTTVISLIC